MPSLRSQRGFTLVEMLVVVAILAMLSALVVANFRNTEKTNAVRLGAEQFVGALREAQNYAMAQKRMELVGDPPVSEVPAGGFGVYVDLSVLSGDRTYILFADWNNDASYSGGAEEIRTETLPRYAKIASIKGDGVSLGKLSVIFRPPAGDVIFGELDLPAPNYAKATFAIKCTDQALTSELDVAVTRSSTLIDIINPIILP